MAGQNLKGAKGVFLIMGQWRYGAGTTLEDAKKRFREQGGKLTDGFTLIEFDGDTEYSGVDQMGCFHFKGNSPKRTEVEPGKRLPAKQ